MPVTTFWRSHLILMERRLLLSNGVPEDIANRATGETLMKAFMSGWHSARRRERNSAKRSTEGLEMNRCDFKFGAFPCELRDGHAGEHRGHLPVSPCTGVDGTNDNKTNVRVVRPVGGGILGSQEADLVPLPITDDRDFDYVDPRLKEDADLVIKVQP